MAIPVVSEYTIPGTDETGYLYVKINGVLYPIISVESGGDAIGYGNGGYGEGLYGT
jgi:hypothetical protein